MSRQYFWRISKLLNATLCRMISHNKTWVISTLIYKVFDAFFPEPNRYHQFRGFWECKCIKNYASLNTNLSRWQPNILCNILFLQLLYYLYTDKSPNVTTSTCVNLIELANRLCLPRLVTLVEATIIHIFTEALGLGDDISEEALKILEPCQVSKNWDIQSVLEYSQIFKIL